MSAGTWDYRDHMGEAAAREARANLMSATNDRQTDRAPASFTQGSPSVTPRPTAIPCGRDVAAETLAQKRSWVLLSGIESREAALQAYETALIATIHTDRPEATP